MDEKKCVVCDKKAPQSCSACFKVDYCSAEHQRQHWKMHKRNCSYFQIIEDPEFPELGKGFVATRDIKAGTIILEEEPLIFSVFPDKPACITCGLFFSPGKPGRKCGKCEWPVCSRKCAQMAIHADNECKLFASKGFKLAHVPDKIAKEANTMALFSCLIRVLLLKKNGSDIYNRILELKSDYSVPGIDSVDERIFELLKPILISFNLLIGEDEELLRLLGSFHINCYMGNIPYRDSTCAITALYFKASRLNHSCVPNCDWRISQPPESKLRIRAVVNIDKGQPLTITYYGNFTACATKMRQTITLKAGFQCKCKRCLDPTELGTYSSALVCTFCRTYNSSQIGYLLPEDPLNLCDDSTWRCNSCGMTKPASVLLLPIEEAHRMISSKLHKYIESANGEALMKMCKRVEEKYSGKSLHPNHYLIQDCLRAVVDYFLTRKPAGTSDNDYYVVKCGYHLLAIQDVISPGWTQSRAELQHRIATALRFQIHLRNQSVSEGRLDSLYGVNELYKESLKYYEGDFPRTDERESEAKALRSSSERLQDEMIKICLKKMFPTYEYK